MPTNVYRHVYLDVVAVRWLYVWNDFEVQMGRDNAELALFVDL